MKPVTTERSSRRSHDKSEDNNIRYKLNMEYFNKLNKLSKSKVSKKSENINSDDNSDNDVRYMFPTVLVKPLNVNQVDQKSKSKPKIKVNFWSNKHTVNRLNKVKDKTNRRHTVAVANQEAIKPKTASVKVRKRVSFLPSPLFTENHIPMVTVPDDLTIQLNEEEVNDLREDLAHAFFNDNSSKLSNLPKQKSDSPKSNRRYKNTDDSENRRHNNENELEFFSKYVVQKLRRMETNQRIYSENLINTVLMLGQLGKLNGKSKIGDA